MNTANRHSKVGDKVTIVHPTTGWNVTGTVDWISPTRGTVRVALTDGWFAFEYPEFDGTYPPPTPRKPWRMAVTNFKGMINNAKEK